MSFKLVYNFASYIVLALLVQNVASHTMLVELTLDGQEQGIGKCIQPYWSKKNFPVNDLSSKDLMCRSSDMNWSSETACPVAAGSQVSVEWNRNKQGTADVISASHTGPCIVYMAAAESKGEGNVWFKIFEEGYDSSSKKWCTDKLIANKGKLDIAIPGDIKAGSYFLRTEIVALHGARRVGQCQFYPNCAQLEVTGGGSAVPDGVALPGYYKSDDPGILYARKSDNSGYVIPGPPVYKGGAGSSSNSSNSKTAKPTPANPKAAEPSPSKSNSVESSSSKPEVVELSESPATSELINSNKPTKPAACVKKRSSRSSKSKRRHKRNSKH